MKSGQVSSFVSVTWKDSSLCSRLSVNIACQNPCGAFDYRRRHDTTRKATLPKEVESDDSAKPTNLSSVSYDLDL